MNEWFECKVKYERTMDDGKVKKVNEPYLVDALSFTEAEERIIEERKHYMSGEFQVSDIKRARYAELFETDDESADRWFKVKLTFITLDDRLARMEDDGMLEIKKKFISLCEERFASVTGCYVIDISKHFFASDRFPLGGAHIVHYEEEFYRQTGEYISEILLGTDRRVFSTVDDNYLLLRSLKLGREG